MLDCIYELNGITFNDFTYGAQVTGYAITEPTGIFSSQEPKYVSQELPTRHGAISYPSYIKPRAVILEGYILAANNADLHARWVRLSRAMTILAEPLPLKIKATGLPPQQIMVKLGAKLDIKSDKNTGPTVARFDIPLTADDPLLYSQTLHEAISWYGASTAGVSVPTVVPLSIGRSEANSLICKNRGTLLAQPTMYIYGPISSPQLIHSDGDTLSFNISLVDGDYLVVNMKDKQVLLNGTANRFHTARGTFFGFTPGNNTVRILGGASEGAGARITAQWRDTWV
jgi:hypothetical protein